MTGQCLKIFLRDGQVISECVSTGANIRIVLEQW